jgi:hypothetical protein
VEVALARLPEARRRQILEELADHIATSRQALAPGDLDGLRQVLARVGDPSAIAEEAGVPPAAPRAIDVWVPWILLFGGFVFFAGWFVGLALLWTSPTWRLREKWLGTLVWPGGFGYPVLVGGLSIFAVAGPGQAAQPVFVAPVFGICLAVVLIGAPIWVAVQLSRAVNRAMAVV